MLDARKTSRSPHGERGLKLQASWKHHPESVSLSSWRAWIEIFLWCCCQCPSSRSPHGERGLKYLQSLGQAQICASLSSWRAWIEIELCRRYARMRKSLSSWRAWIEISSARAISLRPSSRSPHGERGLKYHRSRNELCERVALLMESVD